MRYGLSKLILVMILGLVLVAGAGFMYVSKVPMGASKSSKPTIVIGFSMSTMQEERWQKDKEEFLKRADELGVSVDLESSNNDAKRQIAQIEGMIIKGVDVLVIAPYDAESLTEVIAKAHAAGIKVVSYDRLVKNAGVDVYLSFDNEKVGEFEAQYVVDALKPKMTPGKKLKIAYVGGSTTDNNAILLKKGSFKVLQPLIDAGKIQIVLDKFTPDWKPENAFANLKAYLDKTDGAVDGVVCANDGTAFGVIRALQEHSLVGKVPVSGQDAELAALQRLVQGSQTATVYKPITKLASMGVDLALKLVAGETLPINASVNDGKAEIPSVLLEPIAVTINNIDSTVIKDGYHTREDIYRK